jgi:tetratricopeptide (TPR) repeat protein
LEKSFTTSKLAKLIGATPEVVRRWHRRGLLRGTRKSGRLFFGFQDLVAGRAAKRLIDRGLSVGLVVEALSELSSSVHEHADPLVKLKLDGLNGRLVLNEGSHLIDVGSGQLHLDVFDGPKRPDTAHILRLTPSSNGDESRPKVETLESLIAEARQAEQADDWQSAAQSYRSILRRQPEDVSAIVNLGNCHYQLGEYAVAIEVYRAAVQVRSDCSEAWYNLGNVLDATHQLDAAVSAFQTAIALASGRFEIHYNLALTYEKMGQRGSARGHWLIVIELSDDPHAQRTATVFLEAEGDLEC